MKWKIVHANNIRNERLWSVYLFLFPPNKNTSILIRLKRSTLSCRHSNFQMYSRCCMTCKSSLWWVLMVVVSFKPDNTYRLFPPLSLSYARTHAPKTQPPTPYTHYFCWTTCRGMFSPLLFRGQNRVTAIPVCRTRWCLLLRQVRASLACLKRRPHSY